MPPRDLPFGSDTLIVPCYLAAGPDDPGLAAWKSKHPDWFEAGTWTRAPQPRKRSGEHAAQDASLLGVGRGSAAPDGRVTMRPNPRPPTASSGLGTGTPRPTRREPGREPSSADWADGALRTATFRIGAPSADWPDGVGLTIEKAAATKPQSLPLIDDKGEPVNTPSGPLHGQPMQFRAGFDPHAFMARGLAARRRLEDFGRATDNGGGYNAALILEVDELARFRQAKVWDAQRVDGVVQPEWVDYATVAIGLYAGAAGLTPDEILGIQNTYAGRNSNFTSPATGKPPVMSALYPHLADRNVQNTMLGFELYNSGRFGPGSGTALEKLPTD